MSGNGSNNVIWGPIDDVDWPPALAWAIEKGFDPSYDR